MTDKQAYQVGVSIGEWIVDFIVSILDIIIEMISWYLEWTFYISASLFIIAIILKYFGFLINSETGESIGYGTIVNFCFWCGAALVIPAFIIFELIFK